MGEEKVKEAEGKGKEMEREHGTRRVMQREASVRASSICPSGLSVNMIIIYRQQSLRGFID
jgi:hypothetical protein